MTNQPEPTFGSSGFALVIMALSILAYGSQVASFWFGLGATVVFLILVPIANFASIMKFNSLKMTTYFRWALFIFFMICIGLSGTELCNADGHCESIL